MIKEVKIIQKSFATFVLEVHLGTRNSSGKDETSKKEAMHIAATNKTSTKEDTSDFEVLTGKFISFCETFKYLGTWI